MEATFYFSFWIQHTAGGVLCGVLLPRCCKYPPTKENFWDVTNQNWIFMVLLNLKRINHSRVILLLLQHHHLALCSTYDKIYQGLQMSIEDLAKVKANQQFSLQLSWLFSLFSINLRHMHSCHLKYSQRAACQKAKNFTNLWSLK